MEVDDVVELTWENNRITPVNHSTTKNRRHFPMLERGLIDDRGPTGAVGSRSIQCASLGCGSRVEKSDSSSSCEPSNETKSASGSYEQGTSKICAKRKGNRPDKELRKKVKMLNDRVPDCKERVGTRPMLNQVICYLKTLNHELQKITEGDRFNYLQQTPSFVPVFESVPFPGGAPNAQWLFLAPAANLTTDLSTSSFFPGAVGSAADHQPSMLTSLPTLHSPIASFHPLLRGFSTPLQIPFLPPKFQQRETDFPSNFLFPPSFLSSRGGSTVVFQPSMPHLSFPFLGGIPGAQMQVPFVNGLCSPSSQSTIPSQDYQCWSHSGS